MLTCLSLFSGAGGTSCGFQLVKNRPKLKFIGIDSWELALESYEYNINNSEIICTDIMNLDLSILPSIDILDGSPPCPDFSLANRYRKEDLTLVEKFLKIKGEINPEWWIMEEVPLVGRICDRLGLFEARYLKACDFGLPHVRERLFAGNYPDVTRDPYRGEFTWISKNGQHQTRFLPSPNAQGLYPFSFKRDRGYPVFENLKKMFKTPQAEIRGYGHGRDDRKRVKNQFHALKNVIQKTRVNIDVDNEHFCKIVTPELCQILMGFPETYKFFGNKTNQYKQIGNAVCPPISKAILEAILTKGKKFTNRLQTSLFSRRFHEKQAKMPGRISKKNHKDKQCFLMSWKPINTGVK